LNQSVLFIVYKLSHQISDKLQAERAAAVVVVVLLLLLVVRVVVVVVAGFWRDSHQ